MEHKVLIACNFLLENKLMVVFGFMNSILDVCNYNCKHCSSNSSLQNWHLIFMNLFINIIVSIVQQKLHGNGYSSFEYKYNCKDMSHIKPYVVKEN